MHMLCSTHRRVHVCPIEALAAVSAEERAWLPERFRPHIRAVTAPGCASMGRRGYSRGAEMGKAKSLAYYTE
jgi:hypothetical protein